MQPDWNQATAYIAALTGTDPEATVMEWRALHDVDKGVPGIKRRGTLRQHWAELCTLNAAGYGVFANINVMNGDGNTLEHIHYIHAHAADLDNLSAQQNYEAAAAWTPAPAFAVVSSPGKYHLYWSVQPYTSNEYATLINRKLRQKFDGDKAVIDPSRVLRVPGFYHMKHTPQLVTCHALAGYGQRIPVQALEIALADVTVIEGGAGGRHPLGEPSLAAPSLEWLQYALSLIDPNQLDRGEWISLTSAIKQAGWTYGEAAVRSAWDGWCAQYDKNDAAENEKQWSSIRDTQLGWKSITHRVPHLRATEMFGASPQAMGMPTPQQLEQQRADSAPPSAPGAPPIPTSEILTDTEQRAWFNGIVYVTNLGEMLTPNNRFLNSTQFNVEYGGKRYIIDGAGKTTDEAWKAATRSTLFQIPKVDHIRFIPTRGYGEIIQDDMGRKGVNMFRPPNVRTLVGDPTPFIAHMQVMLPDAGDQRILFDYLAHNIKYPGHKIPWAPVIQSVEGVGKGLIKALMIHCMGRSYTHFPNAHELANSGSTFNAWMRNKTFILADEIKVDDRRDMIEVLKPMISEEIIEVQGKGADQELEDNFSNWCFFTNWHDAIPINKNGRRFAIMYSAMQSMADLLAAGMDDPYFKRLYDWMKADGAAIVARYLLDYPIEKGAIPMRAPITSSTAEAVRLSRGPIERLIADAVEDTAPGFRGGYISTLSIAKRLKDSGKRTLSDNAIEGILRGMGYSGIGRAPRSYFQESGVSNERGYLFHLDARASVEHFATWQGWGEV